MTHTLSLMVAMDRNRVIGVDGGLPWHLPADLRWFRRNTVGKPIVMGRHTWQAIGRALPERPNIVLTRDRDFRAEGAVVVHDFEAALVAAGDAPEVVVIGGGVLFDETIHLADRLYLTVVEGEFAGDTWFPLFDTSEWRETLRERHEADERNPWPCTFLILERING